MTDEEVEATLTEVPGIGPWTARGFLLVALDRPDVFLSGDLALRRAIQRLYGFDHRPDRRRDRRGVGSLAAVPEPRGQLPVRLRVRGVDVTDVGIIGAGRLGQAMARTALRAGRSVVIANSRGPESLTSVVSALGEGVSAGTAHEAAAAAIVVIAVPVGPRARAPCKASAGTARSSSTRPTTGPPTISTGRTSSEIVADLVAGARVVKAANTLGAEVLASDPHQAGGQRVIFISGDDDDAKAEVVALFQDAGFAAIDLGDLASGRRDAADPPSARRLNLIRLRTDERPAGTPNGLRAFRRRYACGPIRMLGEPATIHR